MLVEVGLLNFFFKFGLLCVLLWDFCIGEMFAAQNFWCLRVLTLGHVGAYVGPMLHYRINIPKKRKCFKNVLRPYYNHRCAIESKAVKVCQNVKAESHGLMSCDTF